MYRNKPGWCPRMWGSFDREWQRSPDGAPIWAVWREDEHSSKGRVFPMCVPCCGPQTGGQTQRGSDVKNTQEL